MNNPVSQRYSIFLLAVLTPALLQTRDCASGDTTLSQLELDVAGTNRVISFTPGTRQYLALLPSGENTATLRVQSNDSGAQLSWNANRNGNLIGTGSGEVTVDLPEGSTPLTVLVRASGGAVGNYRVNVKHVPDVDPNTTSIVLAEEDVLTGSGSTFELDFYRNLAYECGLSGNYTFLVIEPRDNPGGVAPLWVYLHGGGVGAYDDQGVYWGTLNQTEDTWNHEESLEDLRDFRLPIAGNGNLRDNTRGRRLAEGYRMLIVSMCDHDIYAGLGTPYPNNPNPGAEVNGLQATMAAVEYTVANYPTTDVFAHGTSAGSNGVYYLSYGFAGAGVQLTGTIMDSTFPTPRYFPLFDAFVGVPGFPFRAGFDYDDVVEKLGVLGDVTLENHTEAVVNAGFTHVPLLVMGGDADPFCAGDQAPIAEATTAGLNNCDWYYDGVRQAVAAQPGSPHQVSILDGVGHVPTHDVQGAGAAASDIVDTFIGDILAGSPPAPFQDN
jgi:hypothetical protein